MRSRKLRSVAVAALCTAAVAVAAPIPAAAWDYPGHRIVGAIADLVLQRHYPAAKRRVGELLDITLANGRAQKRSLRDVAVFPDCAKSGNEPFCGRPPSAEERDYAARNPRNGSYHFTDVPLQQLAYVSGSAGTGDTDVVQMIEYAVAQLRGKPQPAKRDVMLTDTEAVWLLAHLVGDVHQPLHVGAKYFDKDCETSVDPNVAGVGLPNFGIGATIVETMGGNLILLADPPPAVPPADNLHFYWDGAAVFQAMRAANLANDEQNFARLLAAAPPAGWSTAGPPETWATQWATEALPLAAEAHDRLVIRKGGKPAPFTGGCTWETALDPGYQDFASQRARIQVAKAGFRLAALLEEIFGQ
ncbi:MAG: S1/P1 nuclease [Xanthobacteraceae bacterium]